MRVKILNRFFSCEIFFVCQIFFENSYLNILFDETSKISDELIKKRDEIYFNKVTSPEFSITTPSINSI